MKQLSTAAALSLLSVVLALAAACSSDNAPPAPTTTVVPAATNTPPAPASPTVAPTAAAGNNGPATSISPAFRRFAGQINAALQAGNIDFFRQRAKTERVVCTAENTPAQLGGPSCERVGQEFDGFAVGNWRSHGSAVPVESALTQLARLWTQNTAPAADAYGTAAARVHAIGTSSSDEGERYTAIATAMIERPSNFAGAGPLRVAMLLVWAPEGNDFRFEFLLSAFVLAEDFLDPSSEGRGWTPVWERFQP